MWQRWNQSTHIFEKSDNDGASWTPLGLDGAIITEGSIADARLSANVILWGPWYAEVAWTAYTPVWTATGTAPSLGNGTLTGKRSRVGKKVSFQLHFTAGSTTTFGTGDWRFSLPTTLAANALVLVTGFAQDVSGLRYIINSSIVTTTTIALFADASNVNLSSTVPFTWVDTDNIRIQGFYEEV